MRDGDYHLTGDEFRRVAHELVDWVADYRERVESLPVQTSVEPGWMRAQLPSHPPEQPESWDAIVADLDRVIVPALTHWPSPNWFAYFRCTGHVVVDVACVHRARDARARLVGRAAGPP